jgi:hypothetical protein
MGIDGQDEQDEDARVPNMPEGLGVDESTLRPAWTYLTDPDTTPPPQGKAAAVPQPSTPMREEVGKALLNEIRRQVEEIAKQPAGTREAAAALRDLAEALSLVRSIR